MIIDKQPLPDDPTPSEAPPSYETLGSLPHDYRPEKSGVGAWGFCSALVIVGATTSFSQLTPTQISSITDIQQQREGTSNNVVQFFLRQDDPRSTNDRSGACPGPHPAAHRRRGHSSSQHPSLVRRRLRRQPRLTFRPAPRKVHRGTYTLVLGHRQALPDDHQDVEAGQCPDLLTSLISFATPLKPETIKEVRLACLATSDQKLFQRLRLSPEFAPVSGVNQMLLGGTIPPDEIEVEDVSSEGGAFVMSFVVPHFHKRMSVSKEVELEFIARSRMWRLAFYIEPEPKYQGFGPRPGSWCISLSLIESSPPTFLDSQLLIDEAKIDPPDAASMKEPSSQPKPKSTISLRMKSNEQLEVAGRYNSGKNIVVSLEDNLMGANLQYGNNPYIGPDEKLRGRLEARLGKPDTESECVIC
ncbi:hypothetical protein NLJ89_g8628 [Agrocybe chaxingu]|uniref:Uncharacterized protein n=1 Tax=Agrocybe chaxingu TaxID=84603 RepID=A0A9W8JSA7_9AGAR|nr:hypothetical protein NLJ89_g8628 [Agrocybe chaxingu]